MSRAEPSRPERRADAPIGIWIGDGECTVEVGFSVRTVDGEDLTERNAATVRHTGSISIFVYPDQELEIIRHWNATTGETFLELNHTGPHPTPIESVTVASGRISAASLGAGRAPYAMQLGLQSTDMHVGSHRLRHKVKEWFDFLTLIELAAGGLVSTIGFVTSERLLSGVQLTWHEETATVDFEARLMGPPPRGDRFRTEVAIIRLDECLRAGATAVGDAISQLGGLSRPDGRPPNGWLSWYCFYNTITERKICEQSEFIQARYPDLDYVVVDSGWYRESGYGDWRHNDDFPSGMRQLATEIKKTGRKPGLWFAPLLATATSDLVRDHPDWLWSDADGSPAAVMGTALQDRRSERPGLDVTGDDPRVVFALNLTNPEVIGYLDTLFRRARYEWGFEYFKLDFLIRSLVTDRLPSPESGGGHDLVSYGDSSVLEAYERAIATIRNAIGPDAVLMACAGPLVSSANKYFDGNRLTPDITRKNSVHDPRRPSTWELIVQCSRSLAARYMFGSMAYSDPDAIVVRSRDPIGVPDDSALTRSEAEAWATAATLSGGLMMFGDDLTDLDSDRSELMRSLLPSIDGRLEIEDYFTLPAPRVWRYEMADGQLIAVFNWTDQPIVQNVQLSDAAEGARRCVAREFWSGDIHTLAPGEAIELDIPPRAVRLYAVRAADDVPQVIGARGHFAQGLGGGVSSVWDSRSSTLTMRCRFAVGETLVHVPDGYRYIEDHSRFVSDDSLIAVPPLEPNCDRVLAFERRAPR